ncbi:MAG: hypothetical protein WKF83_07705 [Nocardioidaceae bacterium]
MAAIAVAVLVFHCAAMFFADWVDAVPFAEAPADSGARARPREPGGLLGTCRGAG